MIRTLPHPCVHVVFEQPEQRAYIAGVHERRFTRVLHGSGSVFGVKFRAGMFHALFGRTVAHLTNRREQLEKALGQHCRSWSLKVFACEAAEAAIEHSERALLQWLGKPCAELTRVRDLAERIEYDRTITRVETAAAQARVEVRTLERQFKRYVGVSPKWVILRYRLLEAVERLKQTNGSSLASVAQDLGYSDQSHFARDFRSVTGLSPSAFVERTAYAFAPEARR